MPNHAWRKAMGILPFASMQRGVSPSLARPRATTHFRRPAAGCEQFYNWPTEGARKAGIMPYNSNIEYTTDKSMVLTGRETRSMRYHEASNT